VNYSITTGMMDFYPPARIEKQAKQK
jgi:hypothetical protein